MKKLLAILLGLCMGLGLFAGCGQTDDSEEGTPLIGVCMTSMSQSIYVLEAEALTAMFPDCDVQVASCDDDVTTQISQINNFVLLGAEMIIIAPTEIEALADTIVDAYEKGVKVVINGSAGDGSGLGDSYTACTVSDEYLIGCYVALIAKNWAESHLDPNGDWETAFLICSLSDDTLKRSAGIMSVLNEYLMDYEGNYVDAMGNVVDESEKIANPCYSELIASHYNGVSVEQDMAQSNYTTISNVMTQAPNARLFLCYNSLASTEGGQYIVDTYENQLDEFGFFSAGVMGEEADYMVGSISDTSGTKSVFRGACQFGGGDVAASLADLCYKVMYGEEGVDYVKNTPQGIGAWWAVDEDWGSGTATLAYMDIINAVTVTAFDPIADLTGEHATIYWDSVNGYADASTTDDTSGTEATEAAEAIVGDEITAEGLIGNSYTMEEPTPFDFTVYWTLTFTDEETCNLFENNSQMGDTNYTMSWYVEDNVVYTKILSSDTGSTPLADFFDSSNDYAAAWVIVGENFAAVSTGDSEDSGGDTSAEVTVTGDYIPYTMELEGLMGTETLEFDLYPDGTVQFYLPGNTMVADVYAGTYTQEGNVVTITGLTNVDASSSYTTPGLWSDIIDPDTGNATIVIDESAGTWTPAE